jgi:hypothetical protein
LQIASHLRKERAFVQKYFDRVDQCFARTILRHESLHTGFSSLRRELFTAVHGEEKDWNIGNEPLNFFSGSKTAKDRHVDIEDYEVGLERHRFPNRVLSVGGLFENFGAEVRGENGAHTFSNNFLVIGNKYSHGSTLTGGYVDRCS